MSAEQNTPTTTRPRRTSLQRGTMVEAAKRLGITPQRLHYRLHIQKDAVAIATVKSVNQERLSKTQAGESAYSTIARA